MKKQTQFSKKYKKIKMNFKNKRRLSKTINFLRKKNRLQKRIKKQDKQNYLILCHLDLHKVKSSHKNNKNSLNKIHWHLKKLQIKNQKNKTYLNLKISKSNKTHNSQIKVQDQNKNQLLNHSLGKN